MFNEKASNAYHEYLVRAKTLKETNSADRVIIPNGQSRKFYTSHGPNSNVGFVITNCRAVYGTRTIMPKGSGAGNTFHPT